MLDYLANKLRRTEVSPAEANFSSHLIRKLQEQEVKFTRIIRNEVAIGNRMYAPAAASVIYGNKPPTELVRRFNKTPGLMDILETIVLETSSDNATNLLRETIQKLREKIDTQKVPLEFDRMYELDEGVGAELQLIPPYEVLDLILKANPVHFIRQQPFTARIKLLYDEVDDYPVKALIKLAHELGHWREIAEIPNPYIINHERAFAMRPMTEAFPTACSLNLAMALVRNGVFSPNDPDLLYSSAKQLAIYNWVTKGEVNPRGLKGI